MDQLIKHIFVVGFHHKRGCEIEFAYPNLENCETSSLWKKLPGMALPDGSHKCLTDVFYFIFPNEVGKTPSLYFGVACFRQISAESVKMKTDDVTRNTIQKTVVVLCSQPFFGAVGQLLAGITESYFMSGDFSNHDVIVESFEQLNQHFRLILDDHQQKGAADTAKFINDGLSVTELMLRYEHDVLVLLKLILLQKKVVFFMEPVSKLTKTVLTLLSLFPGLLVSDGLHTMGHNIEDDSSDLDGPVEVDKAALDCEEAVELAAEKGGKQHEQEQRDSGAEVDSSSSGGLLENIKSGGGQAMRFLGQWAATAAAVHDSPNVGSKMGWPGLWGVTGSAESLTRAVTPAAGTAEDSQQQQQQLTLPPFIGQRAATTSRAHSSDPRGYPLALFDESNVTLPYANLAFLGLLGNRNIDSFLLGVNNQLWKMKATKYDVFIKEDNRGGSAVEFIVKSGAEVATHSLKQTTGLTIVDRRFIDYLLRVVKAHHGSSPSGIIKSSSSSNFDQDLQQNYCKEPGAKDLLLAPDTSANESHIPNTSSKPASKAEESQALLTFPDLASLENWIRNALEEYLRTLLLNAAGKGTRESFEDFGLDFVQLVQKKKYFKTWYFSVAEDILNQVNKTSFNHIPVYDSSEFALTTSLQIESATEEAEEVVLEDGQQQQPNAGKQHMRRAVNPASWEHPGRAVQARIGDNLPGYYQIRDYAGHSKALVNKSMIEIKKFSSDRGSQIKSSVSAGLSKLSGIAKVHGARLGTTWWQPSNQTAADSTTSTNPLPGTDVASGTQSVLKVHKDE